MEQTPKSKWRFIWILPIIILAASSIPKILMLDFMVSNFGKMGMTHMLPWLGIVELATVIVFLIPQSRRVGFLLVTAYAGGIIATEWGSGQPPVPGLAIQTLLWIGMYFEAPDIFKRNA